MSLTFRTSVTADDKPALIGALRYITEQIESSETGEINLDSDTPTSDLTAESVLTDETDSPETDSLLNSLARDNHPDFPHHQDPQEQA